MRFLVRSLSGLFLLSLTLGLLAYAGYLINGAVQDRLSQEPFIPQARERTFAVNVVTAEPQTLRPVLTVFGEIRSQRTLDIRASASGTVVELAPEFREGGQVRQGQVLLRINPTQAQAALDRAEADLADARSEVRDAERGLGIAQDTLVAARDQEDLRTRALDRQNQLVERGLGSPVAVETAELASAAARQSVLSSRSALAQAEARIDSAATALSRAQIAQREAQRDLDDTVIRAGFDGTLSGVTLVQGRLLAANEVLAQLVDPEALEVAFRVSTTQYARLLDETGRLMGLPVEVALETLGAALTAEGQISRDSAAVGEGQTGRLILATLEKARGLKPGDFVTVRIEEEPVEQVVRLPATALDAAGTVLVVGEDQRLEVQPVTLERRQGDTILVRAPELHGLDVVAQRTPLLGAGILVRPNRPGTAEAETTEPALVELSAEQRQRLMAFVEANSVLPAEVKTRMLGQLEQAKVPAEMVQRLESRMGG
ncbi:efflux RND transporter periplasmic adaptor subunit [Pseudooceanicola sp. HF7]|uniref:efflux RND transporter periplasmic adaptor subunit n=1 Tax=Pseudooceanicola sp. HF7 TaxID=2721560 RepID=UPI0014322AD1|nr:HlyD family efflux transporter periplasmic adaptor subunit [Pseudooceanicola sp. HF7]NIZ08296.1 HlyD family efflux transporter periplasmic adaptor subunit [Pseudooceanicola sp. HF7]